MPGQPLDYWNGLNYAKGLIPPPNEDVPDYLFSALPSRNWAGVLGDITKGIVSLPQRAFGASENLRTGGPYDPGPAVEASMLTMGATPLGAARGAGEAALGAGPVRIVSPAVRSKEGQIFTGAIHTDAADTAKAAGHTVDRANMDGFLTSDGRFVNRKEATQIANAAKQINPDVRYLEPRGVMTHQLKLGSGPTDSKTAGAVMMAAPQGIRTYHGPDVAYLRRSSNENSVLGPQSELEAIQRKIGYVGDDESGPTLRKYGLAGMLGGGAAASQSNRGYAGPLMDIAK